MEIRANVTTSSFTQEPGFLPQLLLQSLEPPSSHHSHPAANAASTTGGKLFFPPFRCPAPKSRTGRNLLAREAGKSRSQASHPGRADERAQEDKLGVVSKLGKWEVKRGEWAVGIPCEERGKVLRTFTGIKNPKGCKFCDRAWYAGTRLQSEH